MKKFMALVLMAIMLVSISAGGMAETVFSFRAYCNNTNDIRRDVDITHSAAKENNDHKIYVRHWVTGGSDAYTNLLRAYSYDAETYYGSKWATVGLNVPIQSNSITAGQTYTMGGRGNTNHYNYDGVVSVTLHGNFYVDYK